MDAEPEIIRKIIADRITEKVLGNPARPVTYTTDQLDRGDEVVKQAIRDCGWAPFHYDRKQDGLAEPWRVYWIDCKTCRWLAGRLPELIPEMKPGNKMPGLLSGCGSLTLFTWLPLEIGECVDEAKARRVDREHLAGTAAAVQNLLLLLTANGIRNYWASGTLIADHLFDILQIPATEVLAAAVFAHYPDGEGEIEVISGKQRSNRSANHDWFREVAFPNGRI